MIEIDGSRGEGGGQILRTSLALSLWTGQPFRMRRVRATRKKPGLGRQHLTAVRAAAAVGQARVSGAELGSLDLSFEPTSLLAGDFVFDVGTAGSAMLLLQTVLPVLMLARSPSRLRLLGGTHNPLAPSFDFIAQTFLPLINRMGPTVQAELKRYGFYPQGGGIVEVAVSPVSQLQPLHLLDWPSGIIGRAKALVCRLPGQVAERELAVVRQTLGWEGQIVESDQTVGNVLTLTIKAGAVTETITSLGERGLAAETVARRACQQAAAYLSCQAPVGEHLADQLLLPLALAGSGEFLTGPLSLHTRTNLETISLFLPGNFRCQELEGGRQRIWL